MSGFTIKTAEALLSARGLNKGGDVQKFIDSEVLRRCEPMVPFRDGFLIRSGIENTKIGTGVVKYQTPYARRWYYEPANFTGEPIRGNYWFQRMKDNGGKDEILKGAAELAGGKVK